MDTTVVPMKSLRFRWQQDISGTILFDVKTYQSYRLNSTAYELWDLCNSSRSVETILQEMASRYPDADSEQVRADLLSALQYLNEKQMIIISDAK